MKTKRKNAKNKPTQPFAPDGSLHVVIETPKGSRNKFKFDEELKRYRLCSVLPAGSEFPYDFGFVPGSKAADGDPFDVLLLMDESAFPGCLVAARLVGVIEGEQTEKTGQKERNDRLVAVANDAHDYRDIRTISDLNKNLLDELGHFFVAYNQTKGKKYRLIATRGPKHALTLLKHSLKKRPK